MKARGTAILAIAAAALIGLTMAATPSYAQRGFRGAAWGGGWRGGWAGPAWRGGGWGYRYGGWRPGLAVGAAAVGVGVGLAASSAWGYPGYGYGYGYPAYYGYSAYPGCLRQVWWGGGWRLVNVC